MASDKPIIAIATGDPAGIGPEISLKAALDPAVRAACRPILVSDANILRTACRCLRHQGRSASGRARRRRRRAGATTRRAGLPAAGGHPLGQTSAAAGRASIAFCGAAVKAALAKQVAAVVAAPQNETSIALAGIPFDGHPSFVARETGTREDDVFMMLCFGNTKIAHATLHQSVRQALDAITRERVGRVIDETARTLPAMGIAAPRIAVSGLNPHAGEGGLFGREEIDIIKPAIDAAAAGGLTVAGPFGADTMFHMQGFDAFIVMLHDQGHIAAKVLAEHAAAALTIGTPILFSSVAHGSAHDIAGKGVADPTAMIEAVLRMAGGASRPSKAALGCPLARYPHERRHDPCTGAQRAAKTAGDLRAAAAAAAIRHRHLEDAQPRPRRPHLHLDVPAVGHLAHVEREQRVAADGAERAHVRVAHAIQQPHAVAGGETGADLVPGDAAGLALAAHARADHEVVAPDWIGATSAAMLAGSSAPSPSMNTMMSASTALTVAIRQARP